MNRILLLPCILLALILGPLGCGGQKTNGADAGGVNAEVTITPADATVSVGQTLDFQAHLSLGSGWSWKVVPPTLGTFSGDGVFLAKTTGSGIVVATWTADTRYVGTTQVTTVPGPLTVITSTPTVDEYTTGITASVPDQPGCTYAWTISGGTQTGGGGTRTLTFSAGAAGKIDLTCTVTNGAGASATGTYQVTVVPLPVITRFEGLPYLVRTGGTTLLYTGFRNGTHAVVTPGDLSVQDGGAVAVDLSQAAQFTLTVSNDAGTSVQATTEVLVGDPCPPAAPSAGDLWTDLATGLEMVYCPPGTFRMGGVEGDPDALGCELPAHDVTLARGFWISRSKVTQDQWVLQMGGNPSFFSELMECATFGAVPLRPVEQVSWEDVQAYLDRINAKLGWRLYRLPSEAEWEYAYRGGTATRYYWGDDASDPAINLARFLPTSSLKTWPVGPVAPHPWNLFDMVGNAMEWVADGYQPDYLGAPAGGAATLGLQSDMRTVRGSSWNDAACFLRASARFARPQSTRSRTLGFRVLRPACAVPVLRSFRATPSGPLPAGGGPVVLSWEVENADRLWVDQGVGAVTGGSSKTVTLTGTQRFILLAENSEGWVMASVKVEVAQ